jgi:hypothetical protein
VFTLNLAVHSYLVLTFTKDEKVSLSVGFYYIKNSGRRLARMASFALIYQWLGLIGYL